MDAPVVAVGRSKRAMRIELEAECLARLADDAESKSTTPKLLVEKLLTEMYPAPVEV